MKTVVVSNRLDPEMGHVGDYLIELGASIHPVMREEFVDQQKIGDDADLFLLLGSDWSVHDAAFSREVAREQDLVRKAHERGVPILAICYGAQLVASALGATVARAPKAEIGWMTIESDDESFIPTGPWFQYHLDRWQDIDKIASIARSDIAPQAFIHGRTLAMQFHPEVQIDVAARWVRQYPEHLVPLGITPEGIDTDSGRFGDDARLMCRSLVDRFLNEVAVRPLH